MKTIINITIDGKSLEVEPGMTILEAAQKENIGNIPTLCYDPELPPFGSCFLCVVEVEGISRLVPACSTPVSKGMIVHTDNSKIRQTRKTALELLLSEHYADCEPPCSLACPANVDVQGYIALISQGKYEQAVKLIRKSNPLPITCGRICVRKCELKCRRPIIDETPVGINFLKRYATDQERKNHQPEKALPSTKHKIAIVGGGPTGLTAAYFLAKKGHQVKIFDMMPELGGMLRYGIPEYRLPKKILDEEIQFILDLGIEVETESKLGSDFTIKSLKQQRFDAVLVALGAWKAQNMRLPLEHETPQVIAGIDYLRNYQQNQGSPLSGKIVVVGGGNTAIDATRTSLREKQVSQVTLVYRRTKKEMPADPLEINAAEEEGVKFEFLVSPIEIITEKGQLKAIRCQRMKLGEPDSSGRRRPMPIPQSEFEIECDYLISAIGQKADAENLDMELTRWGTLQIDENTLETSLPGVFAGGDVVTGPAVVIDAISQGQKAAGNIHQFLTTGSISVSPPQFNSSREKFNQVTDQYYVKYSSEPRAEMKEEPVKLRIVDDREVELGIADEDVEKECSRCLECGCLINDTCRLREYCSEYQVEVENYLGEVKINPIDNSHPLIILDPNKCILCGRCVRTCQDIVGIGVYGFIDRGYQTVVKPGMSKSLSESDCIVCGNCIDACPTGAILQKPADAKPISKQEEQIPHNCSYCSVGCDLFITKKTGGTWQIDSDRDGKIKGPGQGLLCFRGKFGHTYLDDKQRFTSPLVREKNKLIPVNWDKATDILADKFNSITTDGDAQSIGIYASPKQSLEELYLLRSIADHLKVDNYGSLFYLLNNIDLHELDSSVGITASTGGFEDIKGVDTIVTLGEIEYSNPVAAMRIHKELNDGKSLIAINPSPRGTLAKKAEVVLEVKPGDERYLFAGLIREIGESKPVQWGILDKLTNGYYDLQNSIQPFNLRKLEKLTGIRRRYLKKFISELSDPYKNIMLMVNGDQGNLRSEETLGLITSYLIITDRLYRTNNGLLLLRSHSNSQGLAEIFTSYNLAELKDNFSSGRITNLLIMGENPAVDKACAEVLSSSDFLAGIDLFPTQTTEMADVIIPATAFMESPGTIISSQNRVVTREAAFASSLCYNNREILMKLAEKLKCPLPSNSELLSQCFDKYNLNRYVWSDSEQFYQIKQELNLKFETSDGKANLWPLNEQARLVDITDKKIVTLDQWIDKYKQNIGV